MGRRLKLRDLYVFRTVARLGSMGKAATQLAVSPPAISKSITDLEHVLGVRLLDRSRQGVEPTRYGSALLKWSSAVFDDLKQGIEEIDSLADPSRGEVRVSTGEGMPRGTGFGRDRSVITAISSACFLGDSGRNKRFAVPRPA